MSYIPNPVPPAPRRPWLRFLFPALVILICGGLFVTPYVWNWVADFSDDLIPFFMMMSLALPVGILLLTIWWLFFSGFRWRTRLIIFVQLLVLVPLGIYLGVRKVEFTTTQVGMVPVFHFTWQASAKERFDEYERQA